MHSNEIEKHDQDKRLTTFNFNKRNRQTQCQNTIFIAMQVLQTVLL